MSIYAFDSASQIFDASTVDMCSSFQTIELECDRLFQSCLIQLFFDFSTSFPHQEVVG
ncbi:MAG: hypothetical protein RM338_12100 [Nostoc sp. DedQUE12a]|nr:hypothetical protein [Nostoc sp. DedQUE12a]